jgi:hypothetical protein
MRSCEPDLGQAAVHWAERNLRVDKRVLLSPPAGGKAVERWPGQGDGDRERSRLNAPHLLAKVYAGVRYVDGVKATQEVAA